MGIRGFLFQRTWIPPPVFASSEEESQARERAAIRRNEKWYHWTRYLVVAAVVLVLLTVIAAIVGFYVERVEQPRFNRYVPMASMQSDAQVSSLEELPLADEARNLSQGEAKSRSLRWEPMISGRSFSNRGHPRNYPTSHDRYTSKDRHEIPKMSGPQDTKATPDIQPRGHFENYQGHHQRDHDRFQYPPAPFNSKSSYVSTQAPIIPQQNFGYMPSPVPKQPSAYIAPSASQQSFGFGPPANNPQNYGYGPPPSNPLGFDFGSPPSQPQNFGYSPPSANGQSTTGQQVPPFQAPAFPPSSLVQSPQNYGYQPTQQPFAYPPLTSDPWQRYQESIYGTPAPQIMMSTPAPTIYQAPTASTSPPKSDNHEHHHHHDHDHHPLFTQNNGGAYVGQIIPSQKDEEVHHRHSDSDGEHEYVEQGSMDCGFKCTSVGSCISEDHRCDGHVDCSDASDEHDCDCLARIGAKKLCDGIMDCPYGEDEEQCYGCTAEEFSCKDPYDNEVSTKQMCIDKKKHCDGTPDCPNARDESHCFRLGQIQIQERGLMATGLLQKMIGGQWYFICKQQASSDTIDAIAAKTCRMIVGDLGDETPDVTFVPGTSTEYSNLNYALIGDTDAEFQVAGTQCPGKRLINVECPDPMCGYPVSKYEEHTYGGLRPGSSTYPDNQSSDRYRRNRYSIDDQIQGKVVGGYESRIGDWPFLVAISRNGVFHCGGSLIDAQWVLTAAHCTHSFEKYAFEAQVGQIRRYSWSPYEQSRMITEVHVHERYDNKIFSNDIALMKLDRPVYLSKWVTTACMSHDKSMDPEMDEMCTVIGWGDLTEDGNAPDHVQEVSLPVKPCRETFTRESIQMCAGFDEGGKDACQGDSGGPFVCRDYDGRFILAGLVSFGRGCARAGQLGVYTRISAYRKWIDSIVSGDSDTYDNGNYYPKMCDGSKCYRSGGECLFQKMRCDQNIDCLYGDDEVGCSYTVNYVPESYHVDSKVLEAVREAHHGHDEHTHGDGGSKFCHETEEFQCRMSKGCVPLSKRCNGHFDCSDYTDEKDCDCPTILQNSHPNKTCDGLPDCEDDGDELDCDYCNGDSSQVLCVLSDGTCIPNHRWCDGTAHCPYGEDEVDCFRIVRDKTETPTEIFLNSKKSRSLSSGYLFYRREGTEWKQACTEDFGANLEDMVCPYLSLSSTTNKNYKRNAPRYIERKLPVAQGIRGRSSSKDQACDHASVRCGEPSCGERRLYSYAAGKPPPTCGRTGTHPWLGTLLVNGERRCMATILSKQWAGVSSDCLTSSTKLLTKDYVAVKFGQTDLTMKVSSPMEQVKRVNYIKQEGGMTLLHLDKTIMMDHFSAPICTNFQSPLEFNHAALDYCVQVTLISNSFRYYHVTVKVAGDVEDSPHFVIQLDSSGCSVPPEGAFVYCSTDYDTITSWYFIGFLTSSQCSSNAKEVELENPFFGKNSQKYQELISSLPPSVISPPYCNGVRCSHGNCVPKSQICDKVAHCLDEMDERRCKASYQIYRAFGDDEYGAESNGTECPEGHFRCASTYNCVPISTFCDGNYDCGSDDPTDEPEGQCTCRKYLEMVAPEKICDPAGKIDCPDRSDETDCPCRRNSFMCSGSYELDPIPGDCVNRNLQCDGAKDCKNGLDEENCVALSEQLDRFTDERTNTSYKGYVLLRVRDRWHPYCSHDWSTQLATALCKELGYNKLDEIDIRDMREIRYPRRKRTGDGTEGSSERPNLVIWRKDDDILEENSYASVGDLESYEDCNVAYLSCSN